MKDQQVQEYVWQKNAISRGAYNLSTNARKLIALAMSLVPSDAKEPNDYRVEFSVKDFITALGKTRGGEQARYILAAVRECMDSHIEITKPNGEWVGWTWFTESRLLIEEEHEDEDGNKVIARMEANPLNTPDYVPVFWDKIVMEFNPKLGEAIKEYKGKTYINLLDFGKLQSKYALRLYELAMSWSGKEGKDGNRRGDWYIPYMTLADLRQMFAIPKLKYRVTHDFRKKIIDEPVSEINNPDNRMGLYIKPEYHKRGKYLTGVHFNCWRIGKDDPVPVNPATETEKEIDRCETQYPDEFRECIEEVIKNTPQLNLPFWPESSKRVEAKPSALELFYKKYPNKKTKKGKRNDGKRDL